MKCRVIDYGCSYASIHDVDVDEEQQLHAMKMQAINKLRIACRWMSVDHRNGFCRVWLELTHNQHFQCLNLQCTISHFWCRFKVFWCFKIKHEFCGDFLKLIFALNFPLLPFSHNCQQFFQFYEFECNERANNGKWLNGEERTCWVMSSNSNGIFYGIIGWQRKWLNFVIASSHLIVV